MCNKEMLWIVLVICSLALGKTVTPTLNMGKDSSWKYLTKFHFAVGKGQFNFKTKIAKSFDHKTPSLNFKLAVYLHEPWLSIIDQDNCEAKLSAASLVQDVSVPVNGDWSADFSGVLSQTTTDRVWYFALADCERNMSTNVKKSRLKVDLQILNSDGSHFSLEDQYLVQDSLFLTIVFVVVFLVYFLEVIQKWRGNQSVETVQVILMLSISSAVMSHVLKEAHLHVYSMDGSGLLALDFFAESFEVLSTILLTIILILISSGWLLQYPDFPEPETYIPVSILIFIVNVLIVGIGRISDDAWDKVTDYQGLPGVMIVFIRLAMWGWFYYNINNVLTVKKPSEKRFVSLFSRASSAYFWSVVVVVVLSWGVPALSRHRFVVFCMWMVQCIAVVAMSTLFRKKSAFYKISALSASDLPGNLN